jgi:hypothetical protein
MWLCFGHEKAQKGDVTHYRPVPHRYFFNHILLLSTHTILIQNEEPVPFFFLPVEVAEGGRGPTHQILQSGPTHQIKGLLSISVSWFLIK